MSYCNGSLLLSVWRTTRTGTPCSVQTFLETPAAALCTLKVLGSSLGQDSHITEEVCSPYNLPWRHRWGMEWRWMVNVASWPLYPRDCLGTGCIRGWLGPRACLDDFGKSRLYRDSIPGPSSPQRLSYPGPHWMCLSNVMSLQTNAKIKLACHTRAQLFQ